MMTPTNTGCIGQPPSFIPEENNEFEEYVKIFESFCELNSITDAGKKKSAFVAVARQCCFKNFKGSHFSRGSE